MDCDTYIENYLSAHVDGELSEAELREVEAHLAGCVNCRARFAEERAVKALLRERAEMRRTPPMVRGSILAALDAVDAADAASVRPRGRSRRQRRSRAKVLVSPRWPMGWNTSRDRRGRGLRVRDLAWRRGPAPAHAVPPFDVAIDHYAHFVEHFEPNVNSTSPAELSDAYMDHQLPGFLWDFQQAGYKLRGGRIDRLADGTPVAYTFYQGGTGNILCTYMKSHGLRPAPGEASVQEMAAVSITTTGTRTTVSA